MPHPITWRRLGNSDTWHFVRACSNWPAKSAKGAVSVKRKPSSGELCDQCLAKQAAHLESLSKSLPHALKKPGWWERTWRWVFLTGPAAGDED